MSKETFIVLMKLALKDIVFQCGEEWYCQKDGVAMGSKLAVMLTNIWMKMFEKYLGGDIPGDPSDIESGEVLADTTSSHHRNPCGTRVTRRAIRRK